jgi:hypothetical protein
MPQYFFTVRADSADAQESAVVWRERPSGSFRSKPANAFALPAKITTDVLASSSKLRAASVSWRIASGESALTPFPRSNRSASSR